MVGNRKLLLAVLSLGFGVALAFTGPSDAHITSGDGFEDGANLTNIVEAAESDFGGTARPVDGPWNRGAY